MPDCADGSCRACAWGPQLCSHRHSGTAARAWATFAILYARASCQPALHLNDICMTLKCIEEPELGLGAVVCSVCLPCALIWERPLGMYVVLCWCFNLPVLILSAMSYVEVEDCSAGDVRWHFLVNIALSIVQKPQRHWHQESASKARWLCSLPASQAGEPKKRDLSGGWLLVWLRRSMSCEIHHPRPQISANCRRLRALKKTYQRWKPNQKHRYIYIDTI